VRQARIPPWTYSSMALMGTICMSPMTLSQAIIRAAATGTPLWIALAIPIAMLGTYASVQLVDAPLAPWAAAVDNALRYPRAIFYVLGAALMMSPWLNILGETLLPRTSRLFLALVILAVVACSLRLGAEATTRFIGFLGLFVGISVTFLLALGVAKAGWHHLLPHLLGEGTIPWLWPTILFVPRGYDTVAAYGPLAAPPWKRPVYLALLVGALIDWIAVVLPVLVYGYPASAQDPTPLLRALGTFTSPYLPFQRVGFVALIIWQFNVIAVVTYYCLAALLSFRAPAMPLVPWLPLALVVLAVLVLTYLPLPIDLLGISMNIWSLGGFLLYLVLPLMLLSLGRRRAGQAAAA